MTRTYERHEFLIRNEYRLGKTDVAATPEPASLRSPSEAQLPSQLNSSGAPGEKIALATIVSSHTMHLNACRQPIFPSEVMPNRPSQRTKPRHQRISGDTDTAAPGGAPQMGGGRAVGRQWYGPLDPLQGDRATPQGQCLPVAIHSLSRYGAIEDRTQLSGTRWPLVRYRLDPMTTLPTDQRPQSHTHTHTHR